MLPNQPQQRNADNGPSNRQQCGMRPRPNYRNAIFIMLTRSYEHSYALQTHPTTRQQPTSDNAAAILALADLRIGSVDGWALHWPAGLCPC